MTLAALRRSRDGREKRKLTPAQQHVVDLSQWFTEPWLADVVAQIADVRGKHVLEPSCGDGEIMRACGCTGARHVTGIELDNKLGWRTAGRFEANRRVTTIVGVDFLADERIGSLIGRRRVDVAAMNPPYENGTDAAHLERALAIAPRAVAIMRLNALAGAARYERLWSRFDVRQVLVLPQRPDFGREARRVGMVSTGAESDFCVVDVLARSPRVGDRPSFGWIRRPA